MAERRADPSRVNPGDGRDVFFPALYIVAFFPAANSIHSVPSAAHSQIPTIPCKTLNQFILPCYSLPCLPSPWIRESSSEALGSIPGPELGVLGLEVSSFRHSPLVPGPGSRRTTPHSPLALFAHTNHCEPHRTPPTKSFRFSRFRDCAHTLTPATPLFSWTSFTTPITPRG